MNADQLREIRERHEAEEREQRRPVIAAGMIRVGDTAPLHLDRAFLLAEVDRLKALCGRAAQAVSEYIVEDYPFDQVSPEVLIIELREAAK